MAKIEKDEKSVIIRLKKEDRKDLKTPKQKYMLAKIFYLW